MDFFKNPPNAKDLPPNMRPVGLRSATPLDLAEVQRGQAATTGLFMSGVEQASLGELANTRLTDALKAEAAGDVRGAQAAYRAAQALQQEAAMYASPVPKVEEIGGPVDALEWGVHGLGQGLRSTVPTIAGSLAAGGAALLTRGRVPVGPAAFGGGATVGYNQNMEGFAGEAALDPEVRALNTPEEIIGNARGYGLAAGAFEAAAPAMLARKLVGASPAGVMSAPKTIGIGMLTEGGTETGQNLLQQQGMHNMVDDPSRPFDWSQALNEGAIGALTGGAMSTAGAGADAAWQYRNDALDLAGRGVDAATPYVKAGYAKGKELAGDARDAVAPHLRDIKAGYDAAGVGGAAGVAESKIIEGAGYAADVIEGAVTEAYKKQFGTTFEDDVAEVGASTQDMSDQELIRFANVNKAKAPALARIILGSEKAQGHLTDVDKELLERISLGKGSDVENRRVANVYKTINDNNDLAGKLTDILKNGDVRDPKSRASRQLTDDDIARRDGVRELLSSYGIDTLTQNKLSDLAAKGNNKLFDAAVQRELVAKGKLDHVENGAKILLEIGLAEIAPPPPPKNRKERRKVQTLNNIQEAASRGMKISDLWSRINGYVADAVKGTVYDTRDTKSMLTNQLGGLLEQVATGKQEKEQILQLRSLLGEVIGEKAVEMVDIISDMANSYQRWAGLGGDAEAKIADLKNSIKGREKAALYTIDEMLHGKGSTVSAGDVKDQDGNVREGRRATSTKVLRELTNAYLAGVKQTPEARLERMQSAYAQAERMRQEGDFKGARKLEDKADLEYEKDPMMGYLSAVKKHFGEGKADRATAVVREYLGEINDAATGRRDGLGHAKARPGESRQDSVEDQNDFEGQQAAAELAGAKGNDSDTNEMVDKAQNETGTHQIGSSVDHMVFGANGATASGEFSGGAVSARVRDGQTQSEADKLKDEVDAMNHGGRVKKMSPIKWADTSAKRDGTDADIMLNDMAKGQMEADAKRKEGLRKKMRGTTDSERELIGKELDEIADREGLYKNVKGNGREFYASRINNHLRVVATAPATEGNIEVDADLVQRFRVGDEEYAAQKWAASTGGNKQDFLNSILSVTNDEGTVIKIDFAGMVAEMMRRNQPGDITGLGEKKIDPSLIVDLRSAVLNIATSMMFGDAVQHVDGNPFGEAFAQMSDYTFHPDKFGKRTLDPKKVNWGFDPTKVAYRDPNSGVTLTFGQVFGASGPSAASAVHTNAMSTELSPQELSFVISGELKTEIGKGGKKKQVFVPKPTRNGTIYDSKGNLYAFNPRELLKAMMTRHDMRADDILPTGQDSSGVSKELAAQLVFEGLLLLEKQGFMLSGTPGVLSAPSEVIARQDAQVLNVTASDVEGDNGTVFDLNMTYKDIRGLIGGIERKFAEKRALNPRASAIGIYGGAYDYRSDRALLAQRDLGKKLAATKVANDKYKRGKGDLDAVLDAVMALEQVMKFGDDALTTKDLKDVSTPRGTSAGGRSVSITENGQTTRRTNDTLSRLDENSHDNTEPLFNDPANEFGGAGFNSDKAKAPPSSANEYKAPPVVHLGANKPVRNAPALQYRAEEARSAKLGGKPATFRRERLAQSSIGNESKSRQADLKALASNKPLQAQPTNRTTIGTGANDYAGPAPTPTMSSTTTRTVQPLNAAGQVKTKLAQTKAERDAKAARLRAERAEKRAQRNAPAPAPAPAPEPVGTSAEALLAELSTLPSDGTLLPKINAIAGRGGMPRSAEVSRAANKQHGSYDKWPTAVKRMVNKLERMEGGDGPDGGGGSRASRQEQTSQQQAPSGNATSNTKDVDVAVALADAERRLNDAVEAVVADAVVDDDGNRVSGLYTPKSKTTKALMQVARDVLSLRGSMAHENWHAVEDLLLELGPKGKHIVDTIHAAAAKPESIDWIMDHLIERGEDPVNSAAIDQLTDPSERAAFMFQFFIETGGKMPIPVKTRGFFAKIKNLLKKMVGIQDDLIKAGAFFAYFDKGTFANEMNDAEKVLAGLGETTREKYAAKVAAAAEPLRKMANAVFGHAADRIRELDIPEYTEILEKFQNGNGKSAGFMREHNARSYEFFNKFSRIVAGKDKLSEADKGKIAELVAEVEAYKQQAGAQFDKRRTEIPPSLDPAKIEGTLDDFIHTLLAYGGFPKETKRADVELIANEILMRGFHTQGRHNVLEMYPEKFKKWLSDDPSKDAFVYVKKSTYDAEFARAFSDKSLDELLAAGDEKADSNGREMIRTYINAAQGKAHLALSPELRKLFGAITTGVNLSILPFAVFSQMIEPLQLAFRKNDVSSAMDSAFRGFKDLPRTFKSVDSGTTKDKWENIAADMGIIAEAQAVTMMADIMNEVPMTGKLGKVNDLFFRYNGMEQWGRSMFVASTKNGLEMIKEHDKTKSEVGDQLLEELGLTRGEIPYKDGEVDYTDARIRAAVLRFVNESMAHPDAGTNAMWMNDARFALFAHLKRFTFAHAYHINERIIDKLDKGDLRSLLPVAMMVPWMVAVDTMKDVVKPGEEAYKDAWGVSDYVAHGIERSSLYGRYDIGLGAVENVERGGSGIETASPAGELASKVMRGVGDGRGVDAVKEALPVVGW